MMVSSKSTTLLVVLNEMDTGLAINVACKKTKAFYQEFLVKTF